jgi:hypothetical protein
MGSYNNQLRREQLITPFGVGAMTVLPDGTSIIIGGLDYWFPDEISASKDNFLIDDWRLSKRLGIKRLYGPPTIKSDGPRFVRGRTPDPRIPVLRFPTWYFCKYCRRMEQRELDIAGSIKCPDPVHAQRGIKQPNMFQVPYVVMCRKGHLDDFPWREWAHRAVNPSCKGVLRFAPSGNANPQSTRVYCDACKSSRNLEFISKDNNDGRTYLSTNLEKGETYFCTGNRPWLGAGRLAQENCSQDVRGSFRGSSNLYFSLIETSLYIPTGTNSVPEELIDILSRSNMNAAKILGAGDATKAADLALDLDKNYGNALRKYSIEQLVDAFKDIYGETESHEFEVTDQSRESFLHMEYELFQKPLDNDRLRIQIPDKPYAPDISKYFESIKLVPTLVETSALWGFSRYQSDPTMKFQDGRKMLFLNVADQHSNESWLPAKQNRGEGIFLEFSEEKLSEWEQRLSVRERVAAFTHTSFSDSFQSVQLSPRYALIHTFSHLLLKQLVFFCGYSQASLKERIYVGSGDKKMSGVLIYTSSGDSEGTLGGLVRMGNPGFLEQVIEQALREAEWCSNDPVCTEGSEIREDDEVITRLSSCYACSLIPETACESFNLFLDRSLVVAGSLGDDLAFFKIER